MKAVIVTPGKVTIEAEGTPSEIAELARAMEPAVRRVAPQVREPMSAASDAPTCTCERAAGCRQHPWQHMPVRVRSSLPH